jgi:predicted N-acetyltransferase YhbS
VERPTGLVFKLADRPEELEAIHRLNHETFVEEIPQHSPDAERRLVDKFHATNLYAVALAGGRLVGMVSARTTRPFSLDEKLADLDAHLPRGRRTVEIRLLAVRREHRHGPVFGGLLRTLGGALHERGFELAIMSGTLRQARLYRHLGFVPFGPVVGTEVAPYQPMLLTLERFLAWPRSVRGAAEPRRRGGRSPGSA